MRNVVRVWVLFFLLASVGYAQADMKSLAKRGRAIQDIVFCGHMGRETEGGPLDQADLQKVLQRAEDGVAGCQMLLARWYEMGECVSVDHERAWLWYSEAAVEEPRALVALGRMTELGRGRPASSTAALHYYRQAAEAGVPIGQVALGRMYANGSGVTRDPRTAAEWYRKAAARWSDEAWAELDLLEDRYEIFTAEEKQSDWRRWIDLLKTRSRSRFQGAKELRGYSQNRSALLQLEYRKGANRPEVTTLNSSGDVAFDQVVMAIASRIEMPAPPIYAVGRPSMIVQLPVTSQPEMPAPVTSE